MRVRVKLRLFVVSIIDKAKGTTVPVYVYNNRVDARTTCLALRNHDSGFTYVVRPYRYDELAQAKRKTRRRRRAQEKSFQFAGGDCLQ